MLYKQLGKTGKKVSAVGFGAMRFLPEQYLKGDYDTPASLVLKAIELGVNYVDTAPGYCDDHSEKIVGYAFRQLKQTPYISTKCGLWLATTADGARKRIEESLNRLNVDKITIYNMWCIKTMEDYRRMTAKGGIYDGILKAKEEGLVEHICCTTHLPGADVATIAKEGLVDSITLGYNALNFAYRREGIKACKDAGLGVVIMNPLGGGVIPAHEELFSFIKTAPEQPIVEAALKFLIGQDEISVALPGPSTISHVEDMVKATENITPITDKDLEELAGKLSGKLNTLCTGCSYCDECPQDIPIPKLMDAYNEYLLADNSYETATIRLRDHWSLTGESAKDCTQCGACEGLCTQKLPIMERLKLFANS